MIDSISPSHIRRFILGKQGLWPGRRWSGKAGTAAALRAAEAVQVDPVSVVAQSHDIVLWGRVDGYQSADLQNLLYEERRFFDCGGALFIYPINELPYWRVMMDRCKEEMRWADFATANPALLTAVKDELRLRGPLRNRDLTGKSINHYRGSKETSLALYYLWLTGELMSYGRHGKERIYDFAENVAPGHLQHTADPLEAEEFLMLKAIRQWGAITSRLYANIRKGITGRALPIKVARTELSQRVSAGQLCEFRVDGHKNAHYVLASDLPFLQTLKQGKVPAEWRPVSTSTLDEVTFLSPLEYVSARGRAKELFGFDYIWEIYKPAAKRQYGPYTLPILYDDRLVARMDARVERADEMLVINGLWLEEWFTADEQFRAALQRGLARFMSLVGARTVDDRALPPSYCAK